MFASEERKSRFSADDCAAAAAAFRRLAREEPEDLETSGKIQQSSTQSLANPSPALLLRHLRPPPLVLHRRWDDAEDPVRFLFN